MLQPRNVDVNQNGRVVRRMVVRRRTIDKHSNIFVNKNTTEKTHQLYHRVHFLRPLSTINLQETNGEKVLFIVNIFAQRNIEFLFEKLKYVFFRINNAIFRRADYYYNYNP